MCRMRRKGFWKLTIDNYEGFESGGSFAGGKGNEDLIRTR